MNFQVADWYVNANTNRIHNDIQDIKLETKVMTLLVYLAQHQGHVISRSQLEADVWTDRVISYDALTSCITRLRKVLGDDSRKPRYIETVPKKGYRLIAPVQWLDTEKNTAADVKQSDTKTGPSVTPSEMSPEKRSDNKKLFFSLLFFIVLGISVIAGLVFNTSEPEADKTGSELSDTPSIIVLPFDNLSNLAKQNYFSDGITADISIALSKLSGLRVMATPEKTTESSSQLARYSLTGSVQRADKQLRVNAMLIDNNTRQQLWAEKYDREIIEVFEVQDEITASIVAALSIKLSKEEKRRVAHRYTDNIEAYDQFLKAQALYTLRNKNDNQLARQHFQYAIDIDPEFARAYSSLALSHVDDYRYQWSHGEQSLITAQQLAEKAVAIDNSLPQAHWALAYVQTHSHQYQPAIASLEKALKIRPNYADGYAFLALINIYDDNPAQGLKMIQRAMRLNPNYPAQYQSVLGQAYYSQKEYEKAVVAFRNAINKNFSLVTAHMMLTSALVQMQMNDEAAWAADQLLTLSPKFKAEDASRVFPVKNKVHLQQLINNLRSAGIN